MRHLIIACSAFAVLAVRAEIVIPADASESVRFAAEELRDYLQRITGSSERIVVRGDRLPETRSFVLECGTDGTGADGFRLVSRPPHLHIIGSAERGVLYGVYEFLETYGGCRWYSRTTEIVPKKDAVTWPTDLDRTEKPAFRMRAPFWYEPLADPKFAARLRINARPWRGSAPAKLGGDPFRFGKGLGMCHTFTELLPVAKYGKDHPEYYALVDGRRTVDAGVGGKGESWRVQPCLTNPDVLKVVTESVLEHIRADPTARFFGVSQNDNGHYCRCDRCAAVDAEEGSHAGTIVRFVNAVAEAVEREFPDITIETISYTYSRKPPKKTKLRHNVITCLSTIECDFARSIPESPYAQNVSFRSDIDGWAAMSDQLLVWDYTTAFVHYLQAFPDVRALQGNLRFFRDHGVTMMFEQGCSMGRHADFAELKTWLLAKWMWNPDLPMKDLLDDFFAGYYGAGAPYVREYFELLHDGQQAYSADPEKPLKIEVTYSNPAMTDAFLARAKGLWRAAAEAVEGDPMREYNVKMGAASTDYTILLRHNPMYFFGDAAIAGKIRRHAKSLLDRILEGNIRLGEIEANHNSTLAIIRKSAETPPVIATDGRIVVEEKDIPVLRRGYWADATDDAAASDGRALKLFNTHHQWTVQLPLSQFSFRRGRRYRFRALVRADLRAGFSGNVFAAGVYDERNRKSAGDRIVKTADVRPGYAWYDIAEFEPKGGEMLWMAPGLYDPATGESVAFDAVYIDKLDVEEVD